VADVQVLVDLLAKDDVFALEAELRLAAAALGPRRFVTDFAQPLVRAVGVAWASGQVSIRQEHLLTECMTTQLRVLLAAQQDVASDRVVVLATLPSENHTLGIQMVAVYLALNGLKPRLLGANTPPSEILDAVRGLRACVVGVTVTESADLAITRRALKLLAKGLPSAVSLWVGGTAAPKLERVAPGIRTVETWSQMDGAIASVSSDPVRG